MSVGRLLDGKGHAVITARADQTLREASRLLAEYRIGAVVIGGEGGSVAGILSERDIVRALALHGADALNHPVSQHMTRKVVTCTVAMASSHHIGRPSEGCLVLSFPYRHSALYVMKENGNSVATSSIRRPPHGNVTMRHRVS